MAGYVRQSTYTDGDVIQASDSNNEFSALLDAFNNATGHAHDGTTAEGPIIGLIGDAGITTPLNKLVVDTVSDRFSFYIDVASVATEQVRVEDGLVYPVTTNDIDLGTTVFMFKDGYFAGTLESVNLEVTNIKANDGTASASIADSTGVFTITSAVLTTADINGGTVDNTVIGGTTPLAGNFTSLGATGNITVGGTVDGRDVAADGTKLDGIEALADVTDTANVTAAGALMDSELTNIAAIKALNQGVATTDSPTFVTVNSTTLDTTNIEVTNIKAKDGVSSATIADVTGVMTVASSVLTTTDINGGTIDGTIIGGTTPAAVTTSSLVATTADINGGTLDGTVIGGVSPAAVTTTALVATTADINGGTVEAVLGGTTPAAATVTTLNATGGGSLTGTWTSLGTVSTMDLNGGTIDGTVVGGATPAAGSFTTLSSTGALTTDLASISSTGDLAVADGGTGASTAAAARTNLDVDQAGTALALAIALG